MDVPRENGEDIVYIGSANFSNESANNIETGVIIEDKVFIQKLYSEFFDAVKNESLSYYNESFSAFSLFVLSLYAKFEHHYNKIITNVYTDYERTKLVVAETIFISVDELDALYRDLEELEGLCNIAEETYDEENDGYNEELDDLKEELQALNIEWLEEVVSEDGDLYKLASFDSDVEVGEIMQSDYSQCAFDVKGQDELIEAVVLAAAGGHNMLMIGEPGCGKTMMAQRIPTILPEMTEEECLEVTKIYSISGALSNGHALMKYRPFRAPHHNVSLNALIGGGANAMPGEVSLAHNGVLFLDELAEFSRRTLDALRQPIEDKKVSISRVMNNPG